MAFYDKVDTTKKFRLGTRVRQNGNEFIYLKGVASTAAGSWVFFDADGTTTLTVANSKGRVGISMAANTSATNYSWYQIYGKNTIGKVVTGANNAKVWVTATPGSVDNTDVATDLVVGAIQRSATASNVATFELSYPVCLNEVYN